MIGRGWPFFVAVFDILIDYADGGVTIQLFLTEIVLDRYTVDSDNVSS